MKDDLDALFAARAEWLASRDAAHLPPFESVLAKARRPPWVRRLASALPRVGAAVAAAAALALLVASPVPSRQESSARPERPSLACFDDPSSLRAEANAYAADGAIALAEASFGACLLATPDECSSPDLARPKNATSDVTCAAPRSLEEEILASRIDGDSL